MFGLANHPRRFVLFIVAVLSFFPAMRAVNPEREKMAAGMALGVKKRLLWKNLYNPRQRDQLYEPIDPTAVLPTKNLGVTLFFSRSGELVNGLDDMLDMDTGEEMLAEALEVKFVAEEPPLGDDPTEEEEDAYIEATEGRAQKLAADIRRYAGMMTFQEHRLGLGFSKEWRYDNWYASARSWLGVAERNYWLGTQGREGIAGLMQDAFPDLDGKFNPRDFVSMRWGLGDTHLKLGYVMPFAKRFEWRIGPRCVLPTGRGIGRPTNNKIMPLFLETFKDFARVRLNEVLIEPQLGNNGHYGIGAWSDVTWNPMQRNSRYQLTLQAYAGVDYLFETGEERHLLRKKTAFFDGDDNEITTNSALKTHFNTNDADLRSYINQYVLPKPVTIIVAPGIVAQGGVVANMRFQKASFFVGYDAYYKDAESFERFKNSLDLARYTPDEKVLRKSKEQYKVMGGFSYTTSGKNVNLFFHRFRRLDLSTAFHGAASVSRQNIGHDFVLGISLGMRF